MNSLSQGIGMTSQRTRDRLVQRLRAEGIRDPRVLEALRSTPRHLFVDEALASRAYEDTALPIGYGQTISQPYIVARMTEVLLAEGPLENVLEVGTGSGYQAAVLSGLVERGGSHLAGYLLLAGLIIANTGLLREESIPALDLLSTVAVALSIPLMLDRAVQP